MKCYLSMIAVAILVAACASPDPNTTPTMDWPGAPYSSPSDALVQMHIDETDAVSDQMRLVADSLLYADEEEAKAILDEMCVMIPYWVHEYEFALETLHDRLSRGSASDMPNMEEFKDDILRRLEGVYLIRAEECS